jgi:hypothetical protein
MKEAQLRFHFGRKCLAIRHRLLTEFFPPIESARQKFERPQLPSLVRLRLGLLGLTALEPNINAPTQKRRSGLALFHSRINPANGAVLLGARNGRSNFHISAWLRRASAAAVSRG